MPENSTQGRAIVVLDIGKTISKASLWRPGGHIIAREKRPNQRIRTRDGLALDTVGIEQWLALTLRQFASQANIGSIIPVGHGAAAVIVGRTPSPLGLRGGCATDYEERIDPSIRAAYDAKRDPFSTTGSPALPDGLNLGAQLFARSITDDGQILLWPQYWSWLLSGVAASEVTSLGCHTDLWRPQSRRFSGLVDSMNWAEHFPPLRFAGDALGPITPEWVSRTGLPSDTQIHCGLHDSNAALLAARAFPEIRDNEATVLSTGTWFVAMRTPGPDQNLPTLAEHSDCLLNVDVHANPIASARWMGGRELELLGRVDDAASTIDALSSVLENHTMILPSFVPGVGPFPQHHGRWTNRPDNPTEQRAAMDLYAALMANTMLELIGSRDRVLIEGRFASNELFTRALATLRPRDVVYTAASQADVSFGALTLINGAVRPAAPLHLVEPLPVDLVAYRAAWCLNL